MRHRKSEVMYFGTVPNAHDTGEQDGVMKTALRKTTTMIIRNRIADPTQHTKAAIACLRASGFISCAESCSRFANNRPRIEPNLRIARLIDDLERRFSSTTASGPKNMLRMRQNP